MLVLSQSLCAESGPKSAAEDVVSQILFDYDGSEEFASYLVREDGFLEIEFARNIPENLYAEIITKLRNHPSIPGVLPGRGGPVCQF